MKKPVIFLDRDGTINDDPGYLKEPTQFIFLPRVIEGLLKLQNLGFDLIVITNQSGIGRGYFTKNQLDAVHKHMNDSLYANGINIKNIYICPHSPEANCKCRKPATGLTEQACLENEIDMQKSYMIGDKEADIQLGINSGLKTIQIIGKYPLHTKANWKIKDLVEAYKIIESDI